MKDICHICAIDIDDLFDLSKSAKFIIHSIIPKCGMFASQQLNVEILVFFLCGENDDIDECIRYLIKVDWINDIHYVCWEVCVVTCEKGVEGLFTC